MREFDLSIQMTFGSDEPSTDDQFEQFLDCVYEEFEKIDCFVNVAARLGERRADFATTVEGYDFEDAAKRFLVDVRTALHAAGCHTPRWPRFEPRKRVIEELQDA